MCPQWYVIVGDKRWSSIKMKNQHHVGCTLFCISLCLYFLPRCITSSTHLSHSWANLKNLQLSFGVMCAVDFRHCEAMVEGGVFALSPQSSKYFQIVNSDTRLKRLGRGWVEGKDREPAPELSLTSSLRHFRGNGAHCNSLPDRRHFQQLIRPTFCKNQRKQLWDWNFPIPLVGLHPLHAHKLISGRWKRMWASSLEIEITDLFLFTGFSAPASLSGWCSV